MPTIQKFELSARAISSLALTCALLLALIGASYAWFADMSKPTQEVGFEATAISSYFAGGDGTKDNPYIITTSRHMYYLAWLQNKKVFQTTTTYFKLDADIDMKGQLTGIDTTSGAIPPIGTDSIPFIGHFDGAGHVISNLWISTAPNDWKEQPEGATDQQMTFDGTNVGMFGKISGSGTVTNFVLDRVEVTSDINSATATVGLIAGYVDAGSHVSEIGVYNGIMSFKNNAKVSTTYSLIGACDDENILWEDRPGGDTTGGGSGGGEGTDEDSKGGAITIIPSMEDENGNAVFGDITTVTAVPVAGAAENSAYFVGTIDKDSSNSTSFLDASSSKDGNGNYNYPDKPGSNFYPNFADMPTQTAGQETPKYKIWQYVENTGSKDYFIPGKAKAVRVPGGLAVGDVQSTTVDGKSQYSVPDSGKVAVHGGLQIPSHGVWFKPLVSGTASIAFFTTDNSNYGRMAVYSCIRDASGNLTGLREEQIFTLPQINKCIVYFEYPVEEGREYVIGASLSNQNKALGLVALVLAGASETDGPETDDSTELTPGPGEETLVRDLIKDVDYIATLPTTLDPIDWATHVQSDVILSFAGENVSGTIRYRAEKVSSDPGAEQTEQKVYYFNELSPQITINDTRVSGMSAHSNQGFLVRETK